MMALSDSLFRSDSRAVETTTGWYVALLSLWCWAGGWFGGFLPQLVALHGYEALVAAVGIPWGLFHVKAAHGDSSKARRINCQVALFAFSVLAIVIGIERGWDSPGPPAFFLAAFVQGWSYLRIRPE